MIVKDIIYGDFEIEKVLQEIIETKEIQRLKGVYQGGASFLVNKNWNVTRYDHSIGTMLLIKLLNGSIEEQIAGLIHDISHTAFSHVVDYALENNKEDYHEEIFKKLVKDSSIPIILDKYGYKLTDILDESKWTILERKAPKLCADRIDYTLRDMYHDNKISKLEIDKFLRSLLVINGEIVLSSMESCEWFVNTYYKEVIEYFMHPLNTYAYDRLSKAIKLSMNSNELSIDDLLKEDKGLLDLMKKSNNTNVSNLINQLNYNIDVVESKIDYDIHKTTKLRIVDPTVIINKRLIQSSTLSNTITKINYLMKQKIEEGTYVKLV